MVVPVWVSHGKSPNREELVYALLDSQSDTSFILDKTRQSLGVDGPEITLRLSTMLAKNQEIRSVKVCNLLVRGHDSDIRIPIPTAYSREIIPANRNHIPTPEVAKRWSYLEKIADKLLPLQPCDIGLLIGYDCARALIPRDVIQPKKVDGPYGQRTDLGWGIVGIVGGGTDTQTSDADPFGISHRVVTYEIPSYLVGNPVHNDSEQLPDRLVLSLQNSVKEIIDPAQISQMMEIEFCEDYSNKKISQNDRKFFEQMEDTHQCKDGHYQVPLPLKDPEFIWPNNRTQAEIRLKQLKSRFKRDSNYHKDYIAFMENLIEQGFAEIVSTSIRQHDQHDGKTWFVPHHGVYQANKPSKLRVVFDCSARHHGVALNDHLLTGPDMTNSLVGVLTRFRKEHVAVTCDVQAMFHQFRVPEDHRNLFTFLWWQSGNFCEDPAVFRMTVHLFGATSSPGCANYGLRQLATDYEIEFGSAAANFIRRNFYVDDGLVSMPNAQNVSALVLATVKLCEKGGLRLHKFASNSDVVLKSVCADESQKIKILGDGFDIPMERPLGVQWNIELDQFNFRVVLKDKPLTRKGVMSTISSIYDPLGFLAPVLLRGRQILQQICRDGGEWDDPIPDDIQSAWAKWRMSLMNIDKAQIDRCYKPREFGPAQSISLHNFSDASENGYGQCSYLRLVDDQNRVHCSFVMGKSRVTPTKLVTIPRLELTAAVLSVKVNDFLNRELDYEQISNIFWTDSRVVLGYISNDAKRFHMFVANRVQHIRSRTDPSQWRHVHSAENPADEASRGISADEFLRNSKWLRGPDFLWEQTLQEKEEVLDTEGPQNDPEVRKVKVFVSISNDLAFDVSRFERFSSWTHLRVAEAWCLRYISRLKSKVAERKQINNEDQNLQPKLTVQDLQNADHALIRIVQQDCFSDELKTLKALNNDPVDRSDLTARKGELKKSSKLCGLDPYVDADGIIRVGGRLSLSRFPRSVRHPVVLPRKSHVSDLLVRHFHEKAAHQGRGITTNTLRANGFWIIGCSSAVSSVIFRCVTCRKRRGTVLEQKMADIPEDRLEPEPAFTFCAVDYFGPFYVKEGRKQLKRYGALFTCMTSRAVHIEVADSLSTDSFINALRRFIAIRGPIRQLRSDQGTNFVGARNELSDCIAEMNHDIVGDFLLKNQCDYMRFNFKMNVPHASHMGGVWERQIRTVRSILNSLIDPAAAQLTDDSLRTLMCEAMVIINSKPLTTDNLNDPNSLEPLTPNHLLTLKSSVILPPPGNFVHEDMFLRKQWRRVQYIANEFWHRWKREYLTSIQVRQKWTRTRRDLAIGDIVMVLEDNLPRCKWQLARVIDIYPDTDGHVRKVKLAMSNKNLDNKGRRAGPASFLERPIQKLILLVESDGE